MKPITIRPANRKDGRRLLALVDALADYEKLKKPTGAARSRLLRDAFGKMKRINVLLAFADEEAVAYAIFFETYSSFLARPTLFLEDIFVLKEYRKKRIGLRLFRECLVEARRRKCGRMEWIVLDWNKPAIRFYDKLGARRMDEWILYRMKP